MSETIIKAENISKSYRLGTRGTGSLKKDITRWYHKITNKESSFFNDPQNDSSINSDIFWALRDINFSINEGEVWGVVGRNGAGKSTLLKILSRITRPTKGTIEGYGKISSLLEVGTGFHPELTGKENIFLSGHFLGMNKAEIKNNFDDIIEFSGVQQFLNTPVKRYSSGMYVRLAFAVAAHLNPDILIVDEVLAVGDAEFQKKCLGKMKDVVKSKGRTIIFVSHNMQAINSLCSKALWLEGGRIKSSGNAYDITNQYLSAHQKKIFRQDWLNGDGPGNEWISMRSVEFIPELPEPDLPLNITHSIKVRFSFINKRKINLVTGLHLFTAAGDCIFDVSTQADEIPEGIIEGECDIPGNFLNDGSYYLSIIFVKDTSQQLFYLEECLHFDVEDFRENTNWYGKWQGYVRPQFPFTLKPNNENS